MTVLPPVNGVRTFSCKGGVHRHCKGAWFSFTRESRVACGCFCHEPAQQVFDLEGIA